MELHPPGPAKGCVLEAPLPAPLPAASPACLCSGQCWCGHQDTGPLTGAGEALGVPSHTQHQAAALRKGCPQPTWERQQKQPGSHPCPSCLGALSSVSTHSPLSQMSRGFQTPKSGLSPTRPLQSRLHPLPLPLHPPGHLGQSWEPLWVPAVSQQMFSALPSPHFRSSHHLPPRHPLLPASDLDTSSLFAQHPEVQHLSQPHHQPLPQRKSHILLRAPWASVGPGQSSGHPSLPLPPTHHCPETPHCCQAAPLPPARLALRTPSLEVSEGIWFELERWGDGRMMGGGMGEGWREGGKEGRREGWVGE